MFKFIFWFLFIIFFIVVEAIMIIFERDKPKNIILYTILFLLTNFVGYAIYLISRVIFNKKKNSLQTKKLEDEIFVGLSAKALKDNNTALDCDFFEFNKRAFNASVTSNNTVEYINDYTKFKSTLCDDLKKASHYILLELTKINKTDFEEIKNILQERAEAGLVVKLVTEYRVPTKLKKELKNAGVKVYKFSKYNTLGGIYANKRNRVIIDGNVAYLGSMNVNSKEISGRFDVCNTFLKIKGDVLQEINLSTHKDMIFASGKYLEYVPGDKETSKTNTYIQFVTNESEKNLELLIIKAICTAQKSIQLQLSEFIPTESVTSLLHFAINSNIDVKLMVPLKTKKGDKYYATRAYAKELALLGANVYLYDGFIRFNAITVDDNYVLYGSYVMDREHLGTSLQDIAVIKDVKAVTYFNKIFESGVQNSYRISDAKYMLLREKFFKNFV